MTEPPGDAESASSHRAWKLGGVLGTALLVAMVTAIGTGLGSHVLELLRGDDKREPISYSASEEINGCGTSLFIAERQAQRLISGARSSPIADWESFRNSNGGAVADASVVQVSIQGESSRTVTLTGIDFTVERRRRPPGAIFAQGCGGPVSGRSVRADLDRQPVAVTGTADDPKAEVDPTSGAALGRYKPIEFPWEVSVTDPLLLQIVASTKRCACTWRAEIPWSSGDQTGEILVDNRGSGYTVIGSQGATGLRPSETGWSEIAG